VFEAWRQNDFGGALPTPHQGHSDQA
jgi:hypothetical protein